jgi:response regulator RpfG family c-di-GMP phosphodiesterase
MPMHKLRALRRVRPIVRHHHERLSRRSCLGRTARADTVSLVAQIMGIVDVFDALRTELPLRVALPVTWAVEELRRALARDGRRAALVAAFLDQVERC